MTEAAKIRRKACPYCGKRLECRSKHLWRNNLARHLARTCAPFQREHMGQILNIVQSLAQSFLPGELEKAQEVAELERLHKLETA